MTEYRYNPGDKVSDGRYIITQRINEGAFGEIYRAEDTKRFNKVCIVKNFAPLSACLDNKNPHDFGDLKDRFKREANLLKEIDHPHIPKLLAFEDNDALIIIQDYIDGDNLYKEVSTKPQKVLSEQEIWEILNAILPILKYIHDRKIYHRDISRNNIIREKNSGIIFLIDFGLAKENRTNDFNAINSIRDKNYGTYKSLYDEEGYKEDLYDLGVTCCHLLSNDNPDNYIDNAGHDWFWSWKTQLEGQDIKPSDSLLLVLKKLVLGQYNSAEQAYEEVRQKQKIEKNIKQWKCVNTIKIDSLFHKRDNYIPIAITPDNKYIISGTNHGKIKFWDTQTGELIKSMQVTETCEGSLLEIALSNNGKFLAISHRSGILKIWKVSDLLTSDNYQPIAIINQPINDETDGNILAFSFSHDSTILAICHSDDMVKLWLIKDNEGVIKIPTTLYPFQQNDNNYDYNPDDDYYDDNDYPWRAFKCLAFNPKQEFQVVAGFSYYWDDIAYSNNIVIWNKYTGEIIKTLSGHLGTTYSISFSLDGNFLVSYGDDKQVKIWDIEKSQELFSLPGHYDTQARVVCSPTEPIIASGGKDTIINIYHLELGDKLQSLNEHSYPIDSLIFGLDGNLLISSSSSKKDNDGEIKIWQKE
ncbi:MAG: protein kinase [Nostocales cyanobacterium LacPavin_0920_SED1_MAG_38_18]|jgi:serine/threonine protein kinase|nr:protein kinase [Nostocales cyanobacterium LacPavin_0920_SED1_MAG_38_18]